MSLSKLAARRRGFTLIELLIVIVVIAILSLIVIPKLMGASRKAKDSTLRANLHVIRNAIEQFQADTNMYPATLADLTVDDGAMGYAVVAGEGAAQEAAVPGGTYKGPYLRSDGPVIDAATNPIPVNPYASKSTTESEHWTYTGTDGKITVGTLPGADVKDAEGNLYSTY